MHDLPKLFAIRATSPLIFDLSDSWTGPPNRSNNSSSESFVSWPTMVWDGGGISPDQTSACAWTARLRRFAESTATGPGCTEVDELFMGTFHGTNSKRIIENHTRRLKLTEDHAEYCQLTNGTIEMWSFVLGVMLLALPKRDIVKMFTFV